jgi:hypothetical protein
MSEIGRSAGELVTATEAGAIEVMAAQAAERLAGVCVGWPADRFRALVLDVARVRLRHGIPRAEYEVLRREWERRSSAAPPVPLADVRLPTALPTDARGSPAALDRSASAPT